MYCFQYVCVRISLSRCVCVCVCVCTQKNWQTTSQKLMSLSVNVCYTTCSIKKEPPIFVRRKQTSRCNSNLNSYPAVTCHSMLLVRKRQLFPVTAFYAVVELARTLQLETDRNHLFSYGRNRNFCRNCIFRFGRNQNHAKTDFTCLCTMARRWPWSESRW